MAFRAFRVSGLSPEWQRHHPESRYCTLHQENMHMYISIYLQQFILKNRELFTDVARVRRALKSNIKLEQYTFVCNRNAPR